MTPRGPAPRLKAAYACPVRFVAPTLNPTNQLSGAWRPWVNCRPPAFAEEGSMKPMAGHPPAKAVGFGLAQTAGWALLFLSVIKRTARQAALFFMPAFSGGCGGPALPPEKAGLPRTVKPRCGNRKHTVPPSFAGAIHHTRLYASRKRTAGAVLFVHCTPRANQNSPGKGLHGPSGLRFYRRNSRAAAACQSRGAAATSRQLLEYRAFACPCTRVRTCPECLFGRTPFAAKG